MKKENDIIEYDDVTDIYNELSYYKLFDVAEKARWKMSDIPWHDIDKSKVNDTLISVVEKINFGELTTYSATQSFMNLFSDDIDFSQWLAVWLYEETKHPQAMTKWLSENGVGVSGKTITEGRVITPMTDSKVEMLAFNIISEIVAGSLYLQMAKGIDEPVLANIMHKLGVDEMRHSVGFETYCRKYIEQSVEPDRERLICLRAAWSFLQDHDTVAHPVFLTTQSIDELPENSIDGKIRRQVCSRIAKVTGVDIPDPDNIFEVYTEFKKSYRKKRKLAAAA